jgi:ATP-dependent protease ClpP protease subunit
MAGKVSKPLKIQFDGEISAKTASQFKELVALELASKHDALWVTIQCSGGDPASAAMLFEFVRGLPVPTWGHVEEAVFSAGATLYLGFGRRTLAATAKIGLHTAKLTEGSIPQIDESWLLDKFSQIKGHNEQLVAQVEKATKCERGTAEQWVRGCQFWIGQTAVNDGIAEKVENNTKTFLDAVQFVRR